MPASGALARKLETLAALDAGLPDDHAIYHGIHWTRVDRDHAYFGEVDFAVVGPAGRLLLIEQVNGFPDETPEGLVRAGAKGKTNIRARMAYNADMVRQKLAALLRSGEAAVDVLLYCPDYRVRQPGSAGIDPARIVDSPRRAELPAIVRDLVRGGSASGPALQDLHRFLTDQLELVPDVSAIAGQAHTLYTRLAGGLAEWARRIEMAPFRLRVTGTAGSGKTQLALAVFADALTAGRRPLYVCYNRPLADHIARIAPPGGEVATYHQLCDRLLRAAGHVPDFSRPDAFGRMEEAFATLEIPEADRFDVLIVDEGQDFHARWHESLMRLLRPEGAAWWLEDPLQNLYDRPEVPLPGWVRITSDRNYRSPVDIVDTLARLLPPQRAPRPGSPVSGSEVEILAWSDEAGLFEKTRRAITRAIGLGYKRDMIALVTYRGREHSRFTPHDRLGPHSLRAFTGRYDLLGNPIYTQGDFLIDSVHRFKGQAAPCVIFTEIDFAALDPLTVRKLFVGATRASMKLILVMTEGSARLLAEASAAAGVGKS